MSSEYRAVNGEKIKRIRASKGLTQQKMSEDLYIARSCLANYETNKRIPNEDMLNTIAAYLGVQTEELLR